jgi:deoxyribonuclease V
MASKVILSDCFKKPINFVTGFDVAFNEKEAVAAAVTIKYDTLQIKEKKFLHERTPFPYIPSFLSFREGPIIMNLEKKIED